MQKRDGGHNLAQRLRMWLPGVICTFSGMFGIGHLLKPNRRIGGALRLVSLVTFARRLRSMSTSRAA